MIELNCEKNILKFKIISNDESYSKFNISPILDLKIMKTPLRYPLIKGFPPISRACPNFPKIFSSNFVEFSLDFFVQYSIALTP
jgi:hypothetical protein